MLIHLILSPFTDEKKIYIWKSTLIFPEIILGNPQILISSKGTTYRLTTFLVLQNAFHQYIWTNDSKVGSNRPLSMGNHIKVISFPISKRAVWLYSVFLFCEINIWSYFGGFSVLIKRPLTVIYFPLIKGDTNMLKFQKKPETILPMKFYWRWHIVYLDDTPWFQKCLHTQVCKSPTS